MYLQGENSCRVQMRILGFDESNSITILYVLKRIKNACDSNKIWEGAAMWLINYFMKKNSNAAFPARLLLNSASTSKRDKKWIVSRLHRRDEASSSAVRSE